MLNNLISLFTRDLNQLKTEINAYENEADLWRLSGEILNTPGNLALHLVGNLNYFIGARLGNTGYVRNREKEFSEKNVARNEIIDMIDETIDIVSSTLSQLNNTDLEKPFEIDFFKENPTTGYWLLHLTTHLNYHLGQINYHRRMIGG